jgi:hypothetical protein
LLHGHIELLRQGSFFSIKEFTGTEMKMTSKSPKMASSFPGTTLSHSAKTIKTLFQAFCKKSE